MALQAFLTFELRDPARAARSLEAPRAAGQERIAMGRLYIEHAGFSMESATERTPDQSKFYIFESEKIVCAFDSREEALGEYRTRCRAYWHHKMDSAKESERLMGARGLLSMDKNDVIAWQELARLGNQSERTKAAFWIRKLGGPEPAVCEAS
jgi:hypothetical protein